MVPAGAGIAAAAPSANSPQCGQMTGSLSASDSTHVQASLSWHVADVSRSWGDQVLYTIALGTPVTTTLYDSGTYKPGTIFYGWSHDHTFLLPSHSGSFQASAHVTAEVDGFDTNTRSRLTCKYDFYASTTVPAPTPTSYAATTGPNCTQNGSQGVVVSTPDNTWYPTSQGGLVGSGCNGQYLWTHSNGNTASGDTVKWWFHTGLAANATCDVQVYVPATSSIVATAHPAYYAMYDNNGNSHVGGFTIDQLKVNGWQDMGRWPAAGGSISVVLDDRGPTGYGVAADAVRVSCSY